MSTDYPAAVANRPARCTAFLRAALYDALGRGLIDRNPCARMKLLHEDNTRTRVMTGKEEKTLHEHAEGWLRPILKTATLAGLRLGEILALRWEDIDTDRKLIFVSHESKTHKRREVPLIPELEAVFDSLTHVIGKNGASPFVFTAAATDEAFEPYKDYDVANAFKRAARHAEIRNLHLHDLRRTFASRLAQRGVSLQAIAKLLGHGATYVTERYAHLSCDDLREAMGRLEKAAPAVAVGTNPAQEVVPRAVNE